MSMYVNLQVLRIICAFCFVKLLVFFYFSCLLFSLPIGEIKITIKIVCWLFLQLFKRKLRTDMLMNSLITFKKDNGELFSKKLRLASVRFSESSVFVKLCNRSETSFNSYSTVNLSVSSSRCYKTRQNVSCKHCCVHQLDGVSTPLGLLQTSA